MIIIGVDTSVNFESITILKDGKILDQVSFEVESHSPVFVPNLLEIMRNNSVNFDSVDGWGVAIGPGSFTGLRIGLATILGMTFQRDLPVVGVITLRAMALSMGVEGYVSPVIDARKGEIYTGLYLVNKKEIEVLYAERVLPPDKWIEILPDEKIFVGGNGVDRYREAFVSKGNFIFTDFRDPVSYGVALIAFKEIKRGYRGKPLEPFYIRRSDAEINLERKKKKIE